MPTVALRADGRPAADDGNIRCRSAHIDDDGIFLARKTVAARDARRGAAQKRFDGVLARELLRHQTAVAAHDDEGRIDAALLHGAANGAQEILDDGVQPRIEQGTRAALQAVRLAEQLIPAGDGDIRDFCDALLRFLFDDGAVFEGVQLDDADAVQPAAILAHVRLELFPIGIGVDLPRNIGRACALP